MILAALRFLTARGFSAAGAKVALMIFGTIAALLLLSLGKCAYDRSVVSEHEAKVTTKTVQRAAAANEKAATDRRDDDTRIRNQKEELDNARRAKTDTARRHDRGCTVLRQQAKRPSDIPERCRSGG